MDDIIPLASVWLRFLLSLYGRDDSKEPNLFFFLIDLLLIKNNSNLARSVI